MSDGSAADTGNGSEAPGAEVGAAETVRTFVGAVAWGEHRRVWDLLGTEGRSTVLTVASKRGMDDALVARLRDGTATDGEREEFLSDLVNGLRADLAGNDLDAFEYELDPEPPAAGRARVIINSPLPAGLGGALPVASVELTAESGGWRVERLMPRTSK